MKTPLPLVLACAAVGSLVSAQSVTPSATSNQAAVTTDLTVKLNPFVISAAADDGYAPGSLPRHGLVFTGRTPGTFKVHLDNLRLRHADGSTSPIWTNGKDTHNPKIEDTELFTGVQVHCVPLSAVSVK